MPIKGLMWGECEDVRDGYLVLIPFEDQGAVRFEYPETLLETRPDVVTPGGQQSTVFGGGP